MWAGGQRRSPVALTLSKSPISHCTRGWVELGAGLGGCGNYCPHPGLNLETSNPSALLYDAKNCIKDKCKRGGLWKTCCL
jgi:hypothetical protein